jgi:hypothetical protein
MLLYQLGDFDLAERHLRLAVEYGCREEDVRSRLASLSAEDSAEGQEPQEPPAEKEKPQQGFSKANYT